MKKIIGASAVAVLALSSVLVGASAANAAPITCPSGQTVTKTANGTWECSNSGNGSGTGAGWHQGNGNKL